MDGVQRLLDQMTKEQLALKIAREIYKGKEKLLMEIRKKKKYKNFARWESVFLFETNLYLHNF